MRKRGKLWYSGESVCSRHVAFQLDWLASTFMVYWTVRTRIRRTLRHARSWSLSFNPTSASATPVVKSGEANTVDTTRRSWRRNTNTLGSSLTSSQEWRIRPTAWQAVFYSLAYFNVFFWPLTTKINHIVHNGQPGDHMQEPLWFCSNFAHLDLFPSTRLL